VDSSGNCGPINNNKAQQEQHMFHAMGVLDFGKLALVFSVWSV